MRSDLHPSHVPAVVAACATQDLETEHERATLREFVRQLAWLLGATPAEAFAAGRGPVYLVPARTLTTGEAAAAGIRGPRDLFGGVVPHRFVATKAISHPLVAPGAAAIAGWNPDFAARAADAVLAGYTAFEPGDARRAGERLLVRGPVRLKPVRASGGRGQSVVRDAAGLQQALAGMDPDEVRQHGLVLEEHLAEVQTFSVGQVQVGDLAAAYHGRQRLTRSNAGAEVFGGSDLAVVRGGFEALLARDLPPAVRHAVEQARRYDAAVRACYPGFFASRTNYDVALGRDASGRSRSGVLEQSWRVGGATGAELAALEVFRRCPGRASVRTACFEVFGDSPEPPPGAHVHFRGLDPQVGLLTKFTVVEPDGDAC